jgi:ferric-dicitrate binding protein FerR (iron transport regulator)
METSENNLQEIDYLIAMSLSNRANNEELKTLWIWIKKSDENLTYYTKTRDVWVASGLSKSVPHKQRENSFQKIKSKILTNKASATLSAKSFTFRFLKYAAVFILLITIIGVSRYYFIKRTNQPVYTTYFTVEAPRGEKTFLTLTDGTKIWLNAGSRLMYKPNYNSNNRDVYLTGEGYFDVAKNKKIAFIVHTPGVAVRALGTEFNVKAYPDEKIIETTLVKGSISIEHVQKNGKREITLLKPNQKAEFVNPDYNTPIKAIPNKKQVPDKISPKPIQIKLIEKVNTKVYTSWKDRKWVFNNENFDSFSIKLERLYDVKIEFMDDELKKFNLTGTLEEESIEQVLNALKLTIPLKYKITHKKIELYLDNKLNDKYTNILKQ